MTSKLAGAIAALALSLCLGAIVRPARASSPPESRTPTQVQAQAPFGFYVLSLSWAPSFCAGAGQGRAAAECARGAKLGFVLHGLWPQNQHGFPHDCDRASRVPRFVLDQTRGLYPSTSLQIHEWRAHGTCSGLSPSAYFAAVKRARELVRIPPSFQDIDRTQSMSATQAMRAFTSVNPRLRPGMLAMVCRRGFFEEARICLSKDVRDFQPCPEVARHYCHAPEMKVPAPE